MNRYKKESVKGKKIIMIFQGCGIMNISEWAQVTLAQHKRRMAITIDFEEIGKHEVRIVI